MGSLVCANNLCKEEFETNDPRKIYCSRECQIWNNNERARKEREQFKATDKTLKRNYWILAAILNGRPFANVTRSELDKAGFNFMVFTGLGVDNGVQIPVIYDLAINRLDSITYRILRTHGND